MDEYDLALNCALASLPLARAGSSLPWESGFAGMVLSRQPCAALASRFVAPPPVALVPLRALAPASGPSASSWIPPCERPSMQFLRAISFKREVLTWAKDADRIMTRALDKWVLIMQHGDGQCGLSRQVSSLASEQRAEIIRDVFFGRAASTLHKRANSLLLCAAWLEQRSLTVACLSPSCHSARKGCTGTAA